MSNTPLKDAADVVFHADTFERDDAGVTVSMQAVVPVDPLTGSPVDSATETTLASLKSVADSLLTAAQAIQSSAAALNTKTMAVDTGAISGVVALDSASLAALETVSIAGTVPVSGTFYQATQPISGTITVANPTAPGLTDAQIRASALPVSGDFYQVTQPVSVAALPLPAGAATDSAVMLTTKQKGTAAASDHYGQVILAQRRDGDTAEATADGQYATLKQDEAGRLKVATQPASNSAASGSITANAQNVSIPCGRFGNLSVSMVATSLVGHNASFECSNNSTNGTDGTWYGVQAVRSNANTVETTTGTLTATPIYMWHVNVGDYLYFRVRATAHTSGTAAYILKPGSYATEPIPAVQITGTQPVSGTVTATVAGGTVNAVVPATPYFVNSAATTNGALILTGTSGLQAFYATNEGAAVAYVKLYNKATAPTVGTDVPEMIIPIPAAVSGVSGVANPNIGFSGFRFPLGLGIAITGAAIYTDTTAVAAGQVKVKLSRTI